VVTMQFTDAGLHPGRERQRKATSSRDSV
jgi:hypothetical protein